MLSYAASVEPIYCGKPEKLFFEELCHRLDVDPTKCVLIGDNPEMRYWHAMSLLSLGKIDDGLAILREVGRRDRNWIELTLRLPDFRLRADASLKDRVRKLLE